MMCAAPGRRAGVRAARRGSRCRSGHVTRNAAPPLGYRGRRGRARQYEWQEPQSLQPEVHGVPVAGFVTFFTPFTCVADAAELLV